MEQLEPRMNTGNATRVLILLLLALAGLVVAAVGGAMLSSSGRSALYGIVLLQDVTVFILPAVLTALVCYRHPWRLLAVGRGPSWRAVLIVLAVCVVSLPAMNWVVDWNEHLHLPAGMATLERAIRAMEEAARQMTERMLDTRSPGELAAALLVVAVMAGLSEELFFRGAMLGIMLRGRASGHVAVWVVAVVFSAVHMQFLGFVPRLLLGAWLGYLLLWTRSLWAPVIAHALNNGLVVVASYLSGRGLVDAGFVDSLGLPSQPGQVPWLALCSALATALIITLAYQRHFRKTAAKNIG